MAAVIDIGSNSIRLAVAQRVGTSGYKVVYEQRAATRLAKELDKTGHLDEGSVRKSVDAVQAMVLAAKGHGAQLVRAVATSAVREASDAWVFVDAVKAAAGVEVEIITGHEEGRLAFVGAARAFDLHKGTHAVLDVGGGSSELVLVEHGKVKRIISWPIGAVRLTERFGGPAIAPTQGFAEMKKFLDKLLERGLRRYDAPVRALVATGGTLSSLALMQLASEGHAAATTAQLTHEKQAVQKLVQGLELSRRQVRDHLRHLREMSPAERARVPGLSRDRSEIIVAGALTVHRVLKRLDCKRLWVHCGSIRDGVLAELFEAP
jgi:exopolyphosphatase/guanosine-5'-triphosphate,3'-diphosphate pyrophosphatase